MLYLNGVRHGIGKSYFLNGDVEYNGLWINNLPINELYLRQVRLKNGDDLVVSSSIEELGIENEMFNANAITSLLFISLLFSLT